MSGHERRMGLGPLTWMVAAVLGAGALLTWCLIGQVRSRGDIVADTLAQTPRTPIAAFSPGERGRIEGRVRTLGPGLRAPVSGRASVFYELWLEGPEGGAPVRVSERQDFALEDEGGVALVMVQGALITAEGYPDEPAPTGAGTGTGDAEVPACMEGQLSDIAPSPTLRSLLDARGFASAPLAEIAYRECVLAAGAQAAIAGEAMPRGSTSGPAPRARIVLSELGGSGLFIGPPVAARR
ncbi:hypothetical protein [Haliangium ochraceum]|uniref:Uncharacterized protein n=1 Tax=Haliangium ochraceum (strain DSM 14365 / JCM 11303 / SMP-2) TaxID=502025 RepID=D0LJ98_HALO1|nr:hypothetical protein [Haliangium ochraceum]ACY14945.1 hypothetical protein Hoch_2408 [Haliangium ochraceum DSM 14365]